MKNIYKLILASSFFSMILLGTTVQAAEEVKIINAEDKERINELYTQLDSLFFEEDAALKLERTLEIEEELFRLGVEELTYEEVAAKLPVKERINRPVDTSNVKWFSTRENQYTNGKEYEVQVLKAQPKTDKGVLYQSQVVTGLNTSTTGLKASAINVFSLATTNAIASINGVTSLAVTAFDFIKSFSSGFASTTVVNDVKGSHNANLNMTVLFCYVKPMGAADSAQVLSYITNSVEWACNVVLMSNTFINGKPTLFNEAKKFTGTVRANGYSNYAANAVNSYLYNNATSRSYVGSVSGKTANGKNAWVIYPNKPSSISSVY